MVGHVGAAGEEPVLPAPWGAKTDNFLESFFEPQCGQGVPRQSLERTNNSKFCPQPAQSNS